MGEARDCLAALPQPWPTRRPADLYCFPVRIRIPSMGTVIADTHSSHVSLVGDKHYGEESRSLYPPAGLSSLRTCVFRWRPCIAAMHVLNLLAVTNNLTRGCRQNSWRLLAW